MSWGRKIFCIWVYNSLFPRRQYSPFVMCIRRCVTECVTDWRLNRLGIISFHSLSLSFRRHLSQNDESASFHVSYWFWFTFVVSKITSRREKGENIKHIYLLQKKIWYHHFSRPSKKKTQIVHLPAYRTKKKEIHSVLTHKKHNLIVHLGRSNLTFIGRE